VGSTAGSAAGSTTGPMVRTPAVPAARSATDRAGRSVVTEELSGRELEVLRLLSTDLSGPEIARTLFVSVNTLRTHTKHIFGKLGVNTRRAAVSRAVDMGLLPSSGGVAPAGNHQPDHITR